MIMNFEGKKQLSFGWHDILAAVTDKLFIFKLYRMYWNVQPVHSIIQLNYCTDGNRLGISMETENLYIGD